jgi:hypothetical protein
MRDRRQFVDVTVYLARQNGLTPGPGLATSSAAEPFFG